MSADLTAAVSEHAELFNECVASGDWAPFVATFTEDAEMRFVNLPVGPLAGRSAISESLQRWPPKETMSIDAVRAVAPDTVDVTFTWSSGKAGGMTVRWQGEQVAFVERR